MKKILILLLLSGPAMAACPKYNFPDSRLNDELENMCHQISSVLKANPVRIATATISNLTGTTSGTNACPGCVGEYVESVVSAVPFPISGQYGDITSITLTAGDWDVSLIQMTGMITTVSQILLGISSTTGNSTAGLVAGSNNVATYLPTATIKSVGCIPNYRMSFSQDTTVYGKIAADYTGSPTSAARLSARRVR